MFQTKLVAKNETVYVQTSFFSRIVVPLHNVKNHLEQIATNDNKVHAHCILDT